MSMAKTSGERPTESNGNGETVATAPAVVEDTGMSESQLQAEDAAAAQASPDTPQETTGGVEQRESNAKRVHYRGIGTIRRITTEEWKGAGVNDQETVEWNRGNKWTVPVGGEGGLSDNALNLIKDETEFSVE